MRTSCSRTLVFFVLILNLFGIAAFAEELENKKEQSKGVGIYLDQDFLVPFTNEDRDYTMGLAVEFFGQRESGLYPLDGLVRTAAGWLGIRDSDNIDYSFMLGTLAYTPDDLSDPQPIYNDRPYASLIYLSNKRVRSNEKKALAAEILLGILGSRIPGDAQTAFHRRYRYFNDLEETDDPVDPKGWSHQISDGGEFTFRLRLTKSEIIEELSYPGRFDIASTIGVSLGFQTNASVGVAMRWGKLRSPIWSMPYDPVNRGSFIPSKARSEWYLWSAFNARIVGYDALLQGQFKESEVTFSYSELEPVVYDGGVGLTLGYLSSQLTFSANAKTSDLKMFSRSQVWGGVNYVYYY